MMQWSRHSPLSIIQACQNRHLNLFSFLCLECNEKMYVCEPINGWRNDGNGGGIRGAESCDTTTDQCFQRQCSKVARTFPHAYGRHLCWGCRLWHCRWLGSAHLFALASIFDCPVDVIPCNIFWMCNVIPCMPYFCLIGFGPVHNCSS